MPRKIDELVLEWQRILPIPGERNALWQKFGLTTVLPGTYGTFRFQAPNKIAVIVDHLEFAPADPVSLAFSRPRMLINHNEWRPEASMIQPLTGDLIWQTDMPDMVRVPPGESFEFEVGNTSNLWVVTFTLSVRLFAERIPN
jgi:hypothetical protein